MTEHVIKINQDYQRDYRIGQSDLYHTFQRQFDYLLDTRKTVKTSQEFEETYVNDDEFEAQIENFRNSATSLARFCTGYTGVGKTTAIRHCFGLGIDNEAHTNPAKKELIFPVFFQSDTMENPQNFELYPCISAVCSKLEDKHQELRVLLKSQEGKKEFFDFMRRFSPYALEYVDPVDAMDMSDEELIRKKLHGAYKHRPFEFFASRLKFYISKNYTHYQKLIIILDNLETFPEDFQKTIIGKFLKLQNCMQNTLYPANGAYAVHLLISIRPHTNRNLNNDRTLETFPTNEPTITKKKSADLALVFKKCFDYCSRRIAADVTSTEAYQRLMEQNACFPQEYADSIHKLCCLNTKNALAAYARIFVNRFWVQNSMEQTGRDFDSISVMRALACNEEEVFWGDAKTIIPDILLTKRTEDLSIYCLLMLKYFYRQKGFEDYGMNAASVKTIIKELNDIFDPKITDKFLSAVRFLYAQGVINKSTVCFDDMKAQDVDEALRENSKLYISPRGNELYDMLGRDSVYLEMLRENAWRDYENRALYSRFSSRVLMNNAKQIRIFKDLLEYIDYLRETEEDILITAGNVAKQEEYKKIFGDKLAVENLLGGVENSLNYSGIINQDDMRRLLRDVRANISETQKKLV